MRFMHISDTHLGIDPGVDEQGRKRSPEHLWDALETAITVAEKEQVAFLLISGDLFHHSPTVAELDRINGWFCRIPKTHIVLISGNHDYLEPNSGYIGYEWAEHVHFIMEEHITSVDFPEENVTVYGMSYWQPQYEEPLYDALTVADESRINIFLAHGGNARFIPYNPEDLLEKGIDYLAAGHFHTRRVIVENRAIVAGPLQPTETKETGEFGYWLLEMEKDKDGLHSKAEFFPIHEFRQEEYMELQIRKEKGVQIQPDMIGLFFEDINYAADGGLYAEMLENRNFEFLEALGDAKDYYTVYDGEYAWSPYFSAEKGAVVSSAEETSAHAQPVRMRAVMGSPHTEANPHYMRLETHVAGAGMKNQAYEGIYLHKGQNYHVYFWARCVKCPGAFVIKVEKEGKVYASGTIFCEAGTEETYNFFKRYDMTLTASEDVDGAEFIFALEQPGIVEVDFISMMPEDAVDGVFRKDLFEKLRDLKPGFLRFPGGCIVEGNTLDNRYRYKDSLRPVWERKNNWNRWAVHCNNKENDWRGPYSHYNQSLGLGYYEYFLLCEKIGAKAIPVMNVGFACQYQSLELVQIGSPEWEMFLQDALDLIEFANGGTDTTWGAVRAAMGHEAPFNLTMLGIGNEQWQTEKADFFERYVLFEQAIHEKYPEIRLIGSAGPDITSERYEMAWKFYNEHKEQANFVYAVDEHYYVKPQWLYDHVDFYDEYDRTIKVFSGEYAAHPTDGMNMPHANTLEGALSEAAFLTGVERNADVVVLASYAPLFARVNYAQWSPDMIWFDAKGCYGSPSYYVQKMYGSNIGDYTLAVGNEVKDAWKDQVYYSLSYKEATSEIIVKVVNGAEEEKQIGFDLSTWTLADESAAAEILSGPSPDASNSVSDPEHVSTYTGEFKVGDGITLPGYSFAVVRIQAK